MYWRYISLLKAALFLATFIAISFIMISCSPIPYVNVGQNVPMLENKGEVNLNVGFAQSEDTHGLALQAGVALDSSWAAIASFYSMKGDEIEDMTVTSDWEGNGSYFELGAGKYGVKRKEKFSWVYDTFLGVGFASIKSNSIDSEFNLKFIKPFLQGSFGFSNQWLQVSLTPRFAYLNYTDESYRFAEPEYQSEARRFFENNQSKFLFEPGLTVRAGYRSVRLNFNYCTSTFSLDEDYVGIQANTNYVTVGINYLITKKYAALGH